ncbi:MAG: GGDEF domain-containing protein [Pseudomonadota bacterium]
MTLIFAVTFFVIWQRDRARMENLALGIGWLLLAIGFLISQLSPDHWGRAIVAITHVPYTLAAVAISWGVLHRVGVAAPVRPMLAIALTGIATMTVTQTLGNSVVADLYISNLTCGAIMLMSAQLFARAGKHDWVEGFVLIMLVSTAAQFFIRPVLSLMFDGPVAAEAYRETVYYLALMWVFAFGTVLFGLAQVAASVKDQFHALRESTANDDLTGLLMRGEFEQQVDAALARAKSQDTQAALVIGDIDHFKQINDIWGHQVGDNAIAAFGRMISGTIRDCDLAGRIGGEEFCVLVWNADGSIATGLAERLREKAAQLKIDDAALDVRMTASFGVAAHEPGETYRSLFARADKALYEAKSNGRDRVAKSVETSLSQAA